MHPNIRQIHAAGMRARDLVKQILTFSRQDEKELKPLQIGDQLAREVWRARPDTPIILCTGYSSRMDSRRAEAMGIRALLMKPLSLEDLAANVRRVLDEARGGR